MEEIGEWVEWWVTVETRGHNRDLEALLSRRTKAERWT